MPKKKTEIVHMNIAKAIGICLIVVGHSFPENSVSPIRSFVYLFHVPFFFIISGYFFNEKYISQPIHFISRRIKSLWFPFFYWSVSFTLLHNFLFKINAYHQEILFRGDAIAYYSAGTILRKIAYIFFFKSSEQLLGGFWFIPCLFFSTIFFLGIATIAQKNRSPYTLAGLTLFVFIIGNLLVMYDIKLTIFRHDFRTYIITTALYSLGFFYKKYETLVPTSKSILTLAILFLVTINILNFQKINSIGDTIGNFKYAILYLVITPIAGTYCILSISKYIANHFPFIAKTANHIGKGTITILALHFLSFKIVSYIIVTLNDINYSQIASFPVILTSSPWFIAYSFIGIIVPFSLYIFTTKTTLTLKRNWNNKP